MSGTGALPGPAPRRALALSPHLDDAAFSCGGTLARLADAGCEVVVATLFTRSVPNPTGFALACQLDKGLDAAVDYMAIRRDEDAAAMAALGARPLWLDLPEAPHRGYGSAAALFAGMRDDDPVVDALVPLLEAAIAAADCDLLLAPQAIGAHADHLACVRALRRLAPPVRTLWWRDFPYVARTDTPARPFAAAMEALPEAAVAIDLARKTRACACYATQLGFQFGGRAGLDEHLSRSGPTEHLRIGVPPDVPSLPTPGRSRVSGVN